MLLRLVQVFLPYGVVRNAEALGQPSKGSSNSFEPAGDRPSNLVGTVLLHEVKTSDDNVVLITLRAFFRQNPSEALPPCSESRAKAPHPIRRVPRT
jgi:hypothetical protein